MTNRNTNAKKPLNCFDCRHHFITHDPNRPYGCRKFGFKGRMLPSRSVIEAAGTECAYHETKLVSANKRR
ncbi:MAG: hypothetical protein O2938_10030 [Proteobacteria bacterium]|nr:hypothetical protein [Pseudomonadota bacterium]NBR38956.1 hypothetical protein [Alphaproteobacteria bacterium]